MGLEEYSEPKGAYYNPALVAIFPDVAAAEQAVHSLRAAGFTRRDINVARHDDGVTIIVSAPPGESLDDARRVLARHSPSELHPYGSESGGLA